MAGHAQLKFVMTECSKTQIRLIGPIVVMFIFFSVSAGCLDSENQFADAGPLTGDYMEYSCRICYKSFSNKQNARRHEIIHTGQKPWQCDSCERGFTQKVHLIRHYVGVHKFLPPEYATK